MTTGHKLLLEGQDHSETTYLSQKANVYIYVCVCMHIYVYIYIHYCPCLLKEFVLHSCAISCLTFVLVQVLGFLFLFCLPVA